MQQWPRSPRGNSNRPTGAQKALEVVAKLTKGHLLEVFDAAVVSWPTGAGGLQVA
jgi:hypothetical protein